MFDLNKKQRLENRKIFRLSVYLILIVAVVFGYLGFEEIGEKVISKIILGPILGILTGAIAGQFAELLDDLTEGLLSEDFIFHILNQEISIPIFGLVTLIIEILIFA